MRIAHDVLAIHDLQSGFSGGHCDGIAGERVEVWNLVVERVEDFVADRGRRAGNAICHRLAHGHDVRNDAMAGESPKGLACTTESRLHFVGDVKATFLVDCIGDLGEPTRFAGENSIG